ncbi:hypothetical protein NEOLEDRAFT_1179861 [Neolentinus lepideus HHB14362 ss-1]|uniref:F-box domain-containing protein n=1 Tax=Neolentinus lepideus HHB14362 ss-1 TaxID=1314782 RepID=A0A165RCP5_9AGAM|nr:hypothetical protein NEOLEDRAFT_1179861 [Neolentinus lepideus HHB14362 ss-1]
MSKANRCDVGPCLDAIIPFATRWRELSLAGRTTSFASLKKLQASTLDYLETLEIGITNAGAVLTNELTVFESAPQLQRFAVHSIGFPFIAEPDPFPWKNLTHLNVVSGALPGRCLQILKECTELICCELALEYADEFVNYPHITVPRLEALQIRSPFADLLFDYLTLPALRTLKIQPVDCGGIPDVDHTPLYGMVKRSQCNLEKLCVDVSLIHTADIIGTLPLVSGLRYLSMTLKEGSELWYPFITDAIFDALSARLLDDGDWLCLAPKLETLRIGPCVGVASDAIQSMLESRQVWEHMEAIQNDPPSSTMLNNVAIYRPCENCWNAIELWYIQDSAISKSHIQRPPGSRRARSGH